MAEIIQTQLTPHIIGSTIKQVFQIFHQKIRPYPHNPGAKLGLEMALYDLLAKTRECSLYELLGRRRHDKVRLCYHIGAVSPNEVVTQAKTAINSGFKSLKLKADGDVAKDLERILSVLNILPPDGAKGQVYFLSILLSRQVISRQGIIALKC